MSTDGNSTANNPAGMDETLRIVNLASLIIYIGIFIAGILGNGVVIYVTGFRMKRTVNSVWFLNLALADFLFTAFLIFTILSLGNRYQWYFGYLMCKLNTFVIIVNMFASIFLLTAISLDRCLSIWLVVWAQNSRTVRKAQLVSAAAWVAAGFCSIPYVSFRDLVSKGDEIYCLPSETMTVEQNLILITFRFFVGFLVPFLVIFASQVAVGVRARRLQRTKRKRPHTHRLIFSIIAAFFICWLPFHVFQFIGLNGGSWKLVRIGGSLTSCLAFINSCINPVLYVFMCNEFQKKLKQSVCHALESALAEDHLQFMSTRSMSSQFSQISRKSDTSAPM